MAADERGTTLEIPWRHDGHDHIRVVIDHQLAHEARSLLTAFRALRQTSSMAEVRDQAEHIADARDVHLAWGTDADHPRGDWVTIGVLPGGQASG